MEYWKDSENGSVFREDKNASPRFSNDLKWSWRGKSEGVNASPILLYNRISIEKEEFERLTKEWEVYHEIDKIWKKIHLNDQDIKEIKQLSSRITDPILLERINSWTPEKQKSRMEWEALSEKVLGEQESEIDFEM